MYFLTVAFILLWFHGSQSSDSPSYYTAAVYEHKRIESDNEITVEEALVRNMEHYEVASAVAHSKGADLIVFPEYGLIPLLTRDEMETVSVTVPDPHSEKRNPCLEGSDPTWNLLLYNLSCMAMRNEIVVTVNLIDCHPCETDNVSHECPEDGVFYYNANVVFDKDGSIISRYHKEKLFYEPSLNLPTQPQDPTFTTSMGKFATFTCFDILFKHIVDVAQDKDVNAILFPTMWFSAPPFLTSLQNWQSWSTANNIPLLVANIQRPFMGNFGSGIFTPHMGAIGYTYSPDALSKLVVSRVPKNRSQAYPFPNPELSTTIITPSGFSSFSEREDGRDMPELCYREFTLNIPHDHINRLSVGCSHERTVNYTFVRLENPEDSLSVCNNGMCCSLNYSTDGLNDTFYLGVHNGSFHAVDYFWCIENCMVVRCNPLHKTECGGFPMISRTVFHSFSLTANFSTPHIYPSVIKSGVKPAPANQWSYGVRDDDSSFTGHISYSSLAEKPLLVAGLSGRCYDRDP